VRGASKHQSAIKFTKVFWFFFSKKSKKKSVLLKKEAKTSVNYFMYGDVDDLGEA
jgi:hypothetical protein